MRDPARITRILALIEQIWRDNPDLRLGQLLANSASGMEKRLFTYEDNKLEADLVAFKRILESYGVHVKTGATT